MADSSLSHLFKDTIQVSINDLTHRLDPGEIDAQEPPGKILLGKVISNGKLGRNTIASALKRAWASFKGWSWKEDDEGILHFSFATKEDAWNVLNRRPWIICGALLTKWHPSFLLEQTNIEELAAKVSPIFKLPKYIDFERGSFGMGTVRLRATIDIDKALFSGFFMKRKPLKDLWIQYKYEKLPKLCLKCGIISHDQKFCFKPPTVIKDPNGAFFPMYGVWMKYEEEAKWPFSPTLPKWFEEWIIQQRLMMDETFKQQWRIKNSIKTTDDWEARENRRELPGKRRMVEQVVEDLPETGEERVCRYPTVTLPGIGEVCPFEDTDNLVIKKVPDHLTLSVNSDVQSDSDPSNGVLMLTEATTANLNSEINPPVNLKAVVAQAQSTSLPQSHVVASLKDKVQSDSAIETEQTILGDKVHSPMVSGHPPLGPRKKDDYSSLLGSQAHTIPWPSNDLWNMGFKTLTGLGTVDKFMRELSIFNPLMQIEDFRSISSDSGPKKRKALDGILIGPKSSEQYPVGTMCQESTNTLQSSPTPYIAPPSEVDSPHLTLESHSFSPWSGSSGSTKRKRGRLPIAKPAPISQSSNNSPSATKPQSRRRGRPTKVTASSSFSVQPTSFKRNTRKKAQKQQRISAHWDNKIFDLTVDLDNHFYVPPLGTAGGLGFCWKLGVDCRIQLADKNKIIGIIASNPPDCPWALIGTYGPPIYGDKEAFWKDLGDFTCSCPLPLVIIGDLNGTLKDGECLNYVGSSSTSRYSFDLRRMVHRTGLIDLGFLGVKFTWFKRGSSASAGSNLKRARLDRALASADWRIAWPNVILNHLTASSSDHNPILLDTEGGRFCTKAMFKYELMWERDPRVFWVVKKAWNLIQHKDPMVNLYRKLKSTKEHLSSPITHLMFADDVMLFGQASVKEAEAFLECLNLYCSWSGQAVNFQKSTVFFSKGVPSNRANAIANLLGMSKMKKDTIYLGTSLFNSANRSKDMNFLVKKVMARIEGWKSRLLSKNSLCPLCDEDEESSFHLFWQCQYAKALWFGSLWGIRTEGTPCRDWNEWLIWFRDSANRPLNLCFMEFLLGNSTSVSSFPRSQIHFSCHATKGKNHYYPPEDWIACFTDITTASDHAFGAAVFRDCNNRLRTAFSSRLHVTDPTLAEATMLVIAANYATKNNLHKVLFFCDNSPVVQYFNSSLPDNYHQKLAGAADRFRSNVHPLVSFKLCHIPRSQNFCAHNMAKWAKLHNVTGDIDLGSIEMGVFSNKEEWNPGAKGKG
ncbi:hypothetical protein G4B88_011139 [Cannabis sativa]|uniref:RNase H type-1 domain-containing protein n=1 Tax=Cannabis sativa TaxID=3483 RepID=A0A7J6G2T4_CANSA|nr:hypothetical protein G4B88_011139 [Cannabis sativa]